jgi:hypothetical protein
MSDLVRICLSSLLGAVLLAPAFAECEPPEFYNALTGNPIISFYNPTDALPGSFAPLMLAGRKNKHGVITKTYPDGGEVTVYDGPGDGLKSQLQSMCGDDWVKMYLPSVGGSSEYICSGTFVQFSRILTIRRPGFTKGFG